MSFTLYFAGGGSQQQSDEFERLEASRLFSNVNDRSRIMKWLKVLDNHPEYKGKLFIDSGAYSVFTSGKKVDVDDYIKFINEIGDYVTAFAQVDTIQDPAMSHEEKLKCQELTWQNYLYMIERLKPQYVDKLIPLYHADEDIKRFYNLLEWKHPDGHHIQYIGLGAPQKVYRTMRSMFYDEWFKIIKQSSNPNVKTHAFGCTDLKVLKMFPFTSADSTSWVKGAVNSHIYVDEVFVTIATRSKNHPWYATKPLGYKEYVENYVKQRGYTIEQLQADPKAVTMYNIQYLKDWEDNYTCSYNEEKKKQVSLF